MERRIKLLSGSNQCEPNQLINIYNYVIQNHLDECQFAKVKCSKKCGIIMSRYQLGEHCYWDCPRTVIYCSYCKVNFERQHMTIKVLFLLYNFLSARVAVLETQKYVWKTSHQLYFELWSKHTKRRCECTSALDV